MGLLTMKDLLSLLPQERSPYVLRYIVHKIELLCCAAEWHNDVSTVLQSVGKLSIPVNKQLP